MKKVMSTLICIMISVCLSAPPDNSIVIQSSESVNPFKNLISAIGAVEAKHDTLAYNPDEMAAGYFQIRPIRLRDYNQRTGSNYKMKDLYDYKISEKIFLYYASQIGPYDMEMIAKSW